MAVPRNFGFQPRFPAYAGMTGSVFKKLKGQGDKSKTVRFCTTRRNQRSHFRIFNNAISPNLTYCATSRNNSNPMGAIR